MLATGCRKTVLLQGAEVDGLGGEDGGGPSSGAGPQSKGRAEVRDPRGQVPQLTLRLLR